MIMGQGAKAPDRADQELNGFPITLQTHFAGPAQGRGFGRDSDAARGPPSCGLAVENGGRLGEMAGGGKGALRRLIGAPNKAIITRPARDAGLP